MRKLPNPSTKYRVHSTKFQKGQALLLVLLSMAVVLTIVLSIVSRSITDVTVSSREQEALRAFSAAEAGVEKALVAGTASTGSFDNNSSFTSSVSGLADNSYTFNVPDDIFPGDSTSLWFIDHDPNTGDITCSTGKCYTGSSMKVCWGAGALEASIFYATTPGDYSAVKIARAAYDSDATRMLSNKFAAASGSCTIDDKTYSSSALVSFSALGIAASCYNTAGCLLAAKVRPFYGTGLIPIGFDVTGAGNSKLPSQGKKIESTGTSGESTRKVQVYQTFGELPSVFDAAIFSPGDILK